MKTLASSNTKVLKSSYFIAALEKNKREENMLRVTQDHLDKQYTLGMLKINQQILLNQGVANEINFDKFVNRLSQGTYRDKSIDYATFYAQEFPSYYDMMGEKLRQRSKNFFTPFLVECVRKQKEQSGRTIKDFLEYSESTKGKSISTQSQKTKISNKDSRSSSIDTQATLSVKRSISASLSYSQAHSRKSFGNADSAKQKRVKSAFQLSNSDNVSILSEKSIRRERTNASSQAEKYREKLKVAKLAKQFILYNRYYCSKRCDLKNE
jgi:hypothetical protein